MFEVVRTQIVLFRARQSVEEGHGGWGGSMLGRRRKTRNVSRWSECGQNTEVV